MKGHFNYVYIYSIYLSKAVLNSVFSYRKCEFWFNSFAGLMDANIGNFVQREQRWNLKNLSRGLNLHKPGLN